MSPDDSLEFDLRFAVAGDEQAWFRLFLRYRPLLERIAHRFVDAENPDLSGADLVQETWLRIWGGLSQFQGVNAASDALPALFCQWVSQTARRTMLNICESRQAKRRRPAEPLRRLNHLDAAEHTIGGDDKTPSSIVAANQETARIRDIVARLEDPIDRAIIQLVFWEGVSLRAI